MYVPVGILMVGGTAKQNITSSYYTKNHNRQFEF